MPNVEILNHVLGNTVGGSRVLSDTNICFWLALRNNNLSADLVEYIYKYIHVYRSILIDTYSEVGRSQFLAKGMGTTEQITSNNDGNTISLISACYMRCLKS